MLVFSAGKTPFFVELKSKASFSWHRNTSQWTTGIDSKYWDQYMSIREETGIHIHIAFLHTGNLPSPNDLASGCPRECPTGLFVGEIKALAEKIHHRSGAKSYAPDGSSTGYGTSGMIYWAHRDLKLWAPLEVVIPVGGSSCS
jgi:hypothetical protein